MASGLTLDIGANTREVVRGARDIASELEDVGDALDDLARGGDKAGGKLEDSFKGTIRESEKVEKGFKDLGRTAERETKSAAGDVEKVERSFEDLANVAQRESKSAGDDLGRNVKRGAKEANDGVKEIGDESASTAKEMAASFDGSAQSIGDAFQEVAANAFAGFGPAGLIAGTAAAIGLGLVTAEFTRQQEEVDKLKERLGGMYREAIEDGRNYVSEAQIIAEAQDLIWNPERVDEYKRVQSDALTLGVDINTMIRANSGDQEAVNAVTAQGKQLYAEIGRQLTDNDKTNDASAAKRLGEVGKAREGTALIGQELAKNKRLVDETNQFLATSTERQRDANAATRGQGEAVDEVGRKISNLPRDVGVTVTPRVDYSAYNRFKIDVQGNPITIPVRVQNPRLGTRVV